MEKKWGRGTWLGNARYVDKEFGWPVDYNEQVYICSCCGEPIYFSDWENSDFAEFICPICCDCDLELEED